VVVGIVGGVGSAMVSKLMVGVLGWFVIKSKGGFCFSGCLNCMADGVLCCANSVAL